MRHVVTLPLCHLLRNARVTRKSRKDKRERGERRERDIEMPGITDINPLLLNATTSELLQIFHNLQEQRVGTYLRFAGVFKDFLITQDFKAYERQCASITKSFSFTSSEIRDLEAILRHQEKEFLANIIRDIQEFEKEKLKQTSKLQVLLTEQAVSDEEDKHEQQIKETNAEINKAVDGINQKLEELHFESEGLE